MLMVRRVLKILYWVKIIFPPCLGDKKKCFYYTWSKNELIYEYGALLYLVSLDLGFSIDIVANHRSLSRSDH